MPIACADFGLSGAIATINERISRSADEHTIYLLTDPDLNPIAGNLDAWPIEVGRPPGWYQVELVRGDKSYAKRVLNVGLTRNFHLLVGRDVQERVLVRGLIVRGLAWAGLIAVLLAVLGGLLVRRSMLHRVEAINRTTRAIVRGDLSQRVPSRESSDEFEPVGEDHQQHARANTNSAWRSPKHDERHRPRSEDAARRITKPPRGRSARLARGAPVR